MALSYQADLQMIPEQGKPGESVTIKATFRNVEGEIIKVLAAESNYYVSVTLLPQGGGVYSATETIPYEAPKGSYTLNVYAVDGENQRGPKVSAGFTVV